MDISVDDTLPDDVWKDSFDKLLDQRPVLRELNVIKRDVRASFNMNSSYENSCYDNSGSAKLDCEGRKYRVHYLAVPKNTNVKTNKQQLVKSKIISTPVRNITSTNPFKCTLSPIGSWDFQHFKTNDKKEISREQNLHFNATPLNDNIVADTEDAGNVSGSVFQKEILPTRYSLDASPFEIVRNKWKSKQHKKQICFAIDSSIEEEPKTRDDNLSYEVKNKCSLLPPKFSLQPGKWRKTLNCLRRQRNTIKDDRDLKPLKKQDQKGCRTVAVERSKSMTTAITIVGQRKSIYLRSSSNHSLAGTRSFYSLENNNFKRQILQRCEQRRILTFNSAYNEDYLQNCCKIGEGAFGEVFIYTKPKKLRTENNSNENKTVLKIIPIEGKELVNGEVQKTFEQILPEIIISTELCNLKDDKRLTNVTSGFVNLQKVKCVKGCYPDHLQKLWEEYDLRKESENDHPKCFKNNQQYVVLELSYSGNDLEGYQFKNAEQSYYALQQIILTLAVAEKEYQFEHRDLHWGNILVLNTNQQNISYKLDGNDLTVPTRGIQITIIDYTLSRMTFNDCCLYNDISNDEELFNSTGDYQFEIYRMMRKAVNNKWETFEPKTNIFWISYVISKLVEGVKYKNVRSKNHLQYLDKLKQLQTTILSYNSCAECAKDVLLY